MSGKPTPGLPRIPELEADFEILSELGRGGTAVVYRARERLLGREVAIKVIRSTYVEQEEAAARLLREAQTIGGLQHPNIVVLFGTKRMGDGSIALIMQLVPGRTLKQEVAALGPLPFGRARQVLMDVARALEYAHRRRIVHRDIKPENIYIDEQSGVARLADFGVARPWDEESGLTLPGTAIGTPAYMSPEQIDGGTLDGRSDIFSLGAVGYEMLSGQRPWAGESLFNVIYKQKHEELPPLESVRPDIPAALSYAVHRALAKDRQARWTGAGEFLAALADASLAPAGWTPRRVAAGPAPASAPPQPHAIGDEDDGHTIIYRRDGVAPGLPAAVPATPATASPPLPGPTSPGDSAQAGAQAGDAGEVEAGSSQEGAADLEPAAAMADGDSWATVAGEGPVASDTRWPTRRAGVAAGLLVVLIAALVAVAAEVGPWSQQGGGTSPAGVAGNGTGAGSSVQLYPLVGSYQQAVAGDTLPAPLVVRLEGADGAPMAGVAVTFAVLEGQGSVSPAEAVTDTAGLATATWVLHSPGVHRAEARAPTVGVATSFSASAVLLRAARLIHRSPERLNGTAAAAVVEVLAEDGRGQPVAGEYVRFRVAAGGGTIEPQVALTDSTGVARATWAFGSVGPQQVAAALQGVDAPEVAFRAADRVPAAASASGPASGQGAVPAEPPAAPPAPAPAATGAGWARLAPDGTHGCALGGDGSLSCWGANDSGQLGDGSLSRRGAPVRTAVPEPLAGLAAGVSHTCGVGRTGRVFCWGSNASGQLGDGSTTNRSTPVEVATGEGMTMLAAGRSHTCALATSGSLYCWGDNQYGQLGVASRVNWSEPVRAGGNLRFRSITAGWTHTCGIATDGTAWCWGRNTDGQLGDGGSTDRATPAAVVGGHRFTVLAAGSSHTCGVTAAGSLLCWGQNGSGQLGSGSGAAAPAPVAVRSDERFSTVAVGGVHSCGLTAAGVALCWGRNAYGQLGDGTTEDRPTPVRVAAGETFTTLALSGAHSCGRTGSGGWFCWGYNVEGQLGDGTRTSRSVPVPVARRAGQ